MTSYANDTTTNTTSGTTTKTTPAHNETTSSAATTTTTTTTTMQQPSANTAFNNNKKMSTVTTLAKPPSQLDFDCCDGSSSDGREKSDATPENIKKIDEIINEETSSSSSLLLSPVSAAIASTTGVGVGMTTLSPSSTSSTPPLSPASAARFALNSSFVGLGAAIDDSNAKFCLAKKPFCTEKDTLAKSKSNNNIIESNEPIATKPSPTTTTATTTARNSVSATSNNESIYSSSYNNDNRHAVNSDVQNNADDDDSSTATTTTTSATTKQSLAFTIDTFNDKENDPTVQAARYKSMMERFQTRHRRGASMSKLESEQLLDGGTSAATTPTTNVRSSGRHMQRSQETELSTTSAAATPTEQPKVRLRVRDRSTSRVRDASKRHSWSPRSSSSTMAAEPTQTNPAQARKNGTKPSRLPPPAATKGAANLIANRTQFTPRSTAMQLALQKVDFVCPEPPLADFKQLGMDADAVSDTGTYTLDGDNYTEEQKDYMNIDRSGGGGGGEAQSKQKVRPKDLAVKRGGGAVDNSVNISRGSNVLEVNYYHETPVQEKPTQKQKAQLKINTTTSDASDLLLGGHQSAGEFLEQIKSRVLRNMAGGVNTSVGSAVSDCKATADMEKSDDVGCFTSVTTSGVLAKQRALDMHPKMTRCTSLSTSQIDSSEYVSNEVKLKHANPLAAAGGFTDHQKAEYRLNVFSTSGNKDAKFAATRKLIATPPETPTNKTQQELSDTAMLKTAHSKQDWIQEWARNARARSLASDNVKQRKAATQELMTRSYTCAETSAADSLTDDSIYSQQHHQQQQQQYSAKLNKSLAERYRLLPAGDCDFSSDPALNAHNDLAFKPPKSPSKIPSPMHSLGRARSASRTRASLQHILPDMDAGTAEDYLQKTAAAISNLQQSLSRKNSIKSPTHSASPRTRPHPAAHIYTPDEYSPQHSMESGSAVSYRHSPMHRRNLSHETNYSSGGRSAREALMTSSMNEAQLQLLTSGEYLLKQMRRRKNSLDAAAAAAAANMEPVSPIKQQQYGNTQRTNINDDASLSPLRRSSSFSTAKLMAQHQQQQQQQQRKSTTRQARPQFQNIYTPPAARHQYTFAAASNAANAALLKKSASSNNFGQVYSDYDDNLQYYINDEDELGTGGEYYSSGEEDEQRQLSDEYYHQHQQQQQQQQQQLASAEAQAGDAMPVSNTRLNKVLLMRIERSKQRVAGNANVSGSGGGNVSKPNSAPAGKLHAGVVGVVACPNTPELPRRGIKSAPRASAGGAPTKARQSMPRDTSLSRLATHVPNSLDSAKKQLLQTAYGVPNANTNKLNQRVQPKYMDISKYKPAQSNNFLRKNDSKSTLKSGPPDHMKRSPSASSMGLSRADPTRTSNRSVRSVQSVMNSSTTSLGSTRGSSAVRRDVSVNKQKEAEMAMWKRRSTYDPMKAAAEDRRKKEEAKRVAQANKQLANENELPFERPSRSHYRRGQF